MKVSSAVMAGWCIAVALLPTSAIAGPPFRTDDPEPVDYTHWEFYTFTSGTHISGDTSGVGPAFEFNYGLIPNGQLHIVAPTAFDSPAGGPTLFGYGDTEIGFKYRFIEEEKDGSRPQVGMFPLIELPTGNENRGLGAGHVRVFMGTGTEVAIQSAGITLVKGDLAGITRAIVLSRATMRNIRQIWYLHSPTTLSASRLPQAFYIQPSASFSARSLPRLLCRSAPYRSSGTPCACVR
jgi:hypothetical protein